MAVTWTLAGIDLTDHVKYKAWEADENPNFDIRIKAGCNGGVPTVTMFRPTFFVQPLTVICLGSTHDTAKANRAALITAIKAANGSHTATLSRKVNGETTAETWTVLGATYWRMNRHLESKKQYWLGLNVHVPEL